MKERTTVFPEQLKPRLALQIERGGLSCMNGICETAWERFIRGKGKAPVGSLKRVTVPALWDHPGVSRRAESFSLEGRAGK